METFLALHGNLVGGGVILALAAAGWLAATVSRRWLDGRLLVRRLGWLPRAACAEAADGPARIRGVLRASPGPFAVTTVTAGGDVATSSARAPQLWLVTASGVEVEVVGAARVLAWPEPLRGAGGLDPELRADLEGRLAPQELWPFEALPVEVRAVHGGDEVEVVGQLERVADQSAGYREAASKLTVAPLDPSGVAVVATKRPLPWRRTWWAAPLGALLAVGMLAAAPLRASPGAFVSPFHRPAALRRLTERLLFAMRSGDLGEDQGELLLALLPRSELTDRARTLEAMDRHDDAVDVFREAHRDPLDAARSLREHGYLAEAREQLATIRGPQAREEEVRMALPNRSLRSVDARRLEHALRRVCGDDLGCAATPELLRVQANLPVRRFDPLDVLFSDRPIYLERIALMLRVAEAAEPLSRTQEDAQMRWRLELAAAQLQLGAVDEAFLTLDRARRESPRGGWPVHAVRELRNVAHVRARAPHEASAGSGPLGDLIVIARRQERRAWPSTTAGPLGLGARVDAARAGRPVALVHPDTARDLEGLVWYGRDLPRDFRRSQIAILRERWRPLGSSCDLVYETSRARALRALGAYDQARVLEARVRRRREQLYGW